MPRRSVLGPTAVPKCRDNRLPPPADHNPIMTREDRQRGFFVAFGFTADAESECAVFYKKSGRIIKLITVQDILDGEHVARM